MNEHSIDVQRTARYYTLGPTRGTLPSVWVVCHGYRALARDFIHHFRHLDDGSRLIVAPEALSRFYLDNSRPWHGEDQGVGASWMTREDRLAEISDYVRYLDAVWTDVKRQWDAGSSRLIVVGFSQGASTASRWVMRGNVACHHLVLWGATLPDDVDLEDPQSPLRRCGLTFVWGSRDALTPPARIDTLSRRLKGAGMRYEMVHFDGGHRIDTRTLLDLAGRHDKS